MRHFALILALVFLVSAQAQTNTPTQTQTTTAPAVTLSQALELAPNASGDVLTARASLNAAQRDLARVQADPLALRLDTLAAEQTVASAQSDIATSLAASHLNTVQAYFDASEADDSLEVARRQLDIATTTLTATQLRHDAGAATDLDLSGAQNDLAAAQRTVQDATLARALAYRNLSSLLGSDVQVLAPVAPEELPAPPAEADVQAQAASENASLLAAERAVALTQTKLETVDNAFSARADIEAAQDALRNAQTTLADLRATLDLSLQQRYNAVGAALSSLESAQASNATTQDDLTAQRARLDAGSISPLAFAQAELGSVQSDASLHSTLHAVWLATLQLEQAVVGQ